MAKFIIEEQVILGLPEATKQSCLSLGSKELGERALTEEWAACNGEPNRKEKKAIGNAIKALLRKEEKEVEQESEKSVQTEAPEETMDRQRTRAEEIDDLVAELGEAVLSSKAGKVYTNLSHIRLRAESLRKEREQQESVEQAAVNNLLYEDEKRWVLEVAQEIKRKARGRYEVDGSPIDFPTQMRVINKYVKSPRLVIGDEAKAKARIALFNSAMKDITEYKETVEKAEAEAKAAAMTVEVSDENHTVVANSVEEAFAALDQMKTTEAEASVEESVEGSIEESVGQVTGDHDVTEITLAAAKAKAKITLEAIKAEENFSDEWLTKAITELESMDDPVAIEQRIEKMIENIAAKKAAKKQAAEAAEEETVAETTQTQTPEPIDINKILASMKGLEKEFLIELAAWADQHNHRAKTDILKVANGDKASFHKGTLGVLKKHLDRTTIEILTAGAQQRQANEIEKARQEQADAQAAAEEQQKAETKVEAETKQAAEAAEETSGEKPEKEEKVSEKKGHWSYNWALRLIAATKAGFGTVSGWFARSEKSKDLKAMRKWAKKVRKEMRKSIEKGVIVRLDGDREIQDFVLELFTNIANVNGEWEAAMANSRKSGDKIAPRYQTIRNSLRAAMVETDENGVGRATMAAWQLNVIIAACGDKANELFRNTKFSRGEQTNAGLPMSTDDKVWEKTWEIVKDEAALAANYYSAAQTKAMDEHIRKLNGKSGILARIKSLAETFFWATMFVGAVTVLVTVNFVKKNWKSVAVGVAAGVASAVFLGTSFVASAAVTVATVVTVKVAKKVFGWVKNWWTGRKAPKVTVVNPEGTVGANSTMSSNDVTDAEWEEVTANAATC